MGVDKISPGVGLFPVLGEARFFALMEGVFELGRDGLVLGDAEGQDAEDAVEALEEDEDGGGVAELVAVGKGVGLRGRNQRGRQGLEIC